MIGIFATHQSNKMFNITGVGYIKRANNPADGLTRRVVNEVLKGVSRTRYMKRT